MRKWKLLAPLVLTALGALVAGIAVLLQKEESADGDKPAPAPAPIDPARLKTGSYSFISGYRDAVTVEATLPYDSERFSFAVVEEDFISETSDSHAALLYGPDFNLQLEYAAYYGGEDFESLCASLREKHAWLRELSFGDKRCVGCRTGDNLSLFFPIPEDTASYLLVTVQKTPDFDGELEELLEHPELKTMLAGLRFRRA